MRSRVFFKEHGSVVPTRSIWREVLTVLAAVLATFALLAWSHMSDEAARADASFYSGLAVGQLDIAQTVGDAYRQGKADARAELGAVLGAGCTVPDRGQP